MEPGIYYSVATLPGDRNHNEARSNVAKLTIFGAPNAPIVQGKAGNRVIPNGGTTGSSVKVRIFGSEASISSQPLVKYKYRTTPTGAWQNYTAPISYSSNGTYTIYAVAYLADNENIVSEVTTYTFTIDTVPPEIGDVIVPEETDTVVIDVEVDNPEIEDIIISTDPDYEPDDDDPWLNLGEDGDPEEGKTIYELPQGDGNKVIYIWERDKGGNIVGPVIKTIKLNATKIGNMNENNTNFYFKVTDQYLHTSNITKDNITLYVNGFAVDGRVINLTSENIENGKKYTVTMENVNSDGDFEFGVAVDAVFDRAGNNISTNQLIIDSNEITVDNTLPILRVTSRETTANVHAEDDHIKAVMLNGAIIGRTNGNYEVTLREGHNVITVIDEYGNDVHEEIDVEVVEEAVDSVANTPDLYDGMKAAYMVGSDWTTSDYFTDEIYDYDNGEWANAMTPDESLWVWIPRYAYKVKYYTNSSKTQESATPTDYYSFDIIFLRERSNEFIDHSGRIHPLPDDYVIANAFTIEGGASYELRGYWIAKYEMSLEETDDGVEWVETTKDLGGGDIVITNP